MIYCPECGTANRDGSKFCNECGQQLGPQTGVKCPQCGTVNNVQSVFCSNCGGRLLSPTPPPGPIAPPIKGLSLPSKAALEAAEEEPRPDEADVAQRGAEDDGPAWLRDLGATKPVADSVEPSLASAPTEDLPDWLRDLRASLPEEPISQVEPHEEAGLPAEERGQVPDWLMELRPDASSPVVPADEKAAPETEETRSRPDELHGPEALDWPGAVSAEEEELPAWLAALQGPDVPQLAPSEPPAQEGELPDWLVALQGPSEGTSAVTVPAGIGEGELPEWFAALQAPAEAPSPMAEEGEPPSWPAETSPGPEAAGPEWPSEVPLPPETAMPDVQKPLTGHPESPAVAGELEPRELPSWLSDLQFLETASLPVGLAAHGGQNEGEAGEEPLVEAELPDWLVPTPEADTEDVLARAEIPDWLLALKPRELKEEREAVEAPKLKVPGTVEKTGLLAGVADVLPVEMVIAQPRAATTPEAQPAMAETPQARLFATIVAQPPTAVPKAQSRPAGRIMDRLPRWMVYALLLACVAIPILVQDSLAERAIEPPPAVLAAHQAVEAVNEGARVLVAFDYDPTTSAEMDVVAGAIVGHLMDRQAQIRTVSLLPAGPGTTQSLIHRLAAGRPGYQDDGGRQYATLGYLPGQAAAVRFLHQTLPTTWRNSAGEIVADLAPTAGLTSTTSFDLIVVLSAGADTLRWWIEQAGAPGEVPMVAGVSAAVDPIARSYYETDPRQLAGLVAGVVDATAYESARSGEPRITAAMAARLDSQLAGHALIVLVILAGNVVYWVRRAAGRER